MFRKSAIVFLSIFILAIASGTGVRAHPHAWIDLYSELRFDEKGQAVALAQTWLLDPAYSSFATVGLDKDGDGKPDWASLDALLKENMRNLQEHDYFTQVYVDSRLVRFAQVFEMSTRMRDDRLEMQFVLPFKKPVAMSKQEALLYRVFDPTYYIEVVHAEKKDSFRLRNAPPQCSAKLEEPNPDAETVMFAASLDRTQSGGNDLGRFFAQTVTVECQAGG